MIDIGTIGKIKISKKLEKQIQYLHARLGSVEWSGVLIFKANKDISSLRNLSFTAEQLYLQDIGSGASTEFDYNNEILDMYDLIPEAIERKIGLIHTHHTMGAYHSGTDMTELKDNADVYNYYLSLVVDTRGTYVCKIAIPSKEPVIRKVTIINNKGKKQKVSVVTEDPEILVGNLDVEIPKSDVDIWFDERLKEVILDKEFRELERKNKYKSKSKTYKYPQANMNTVDEDMDMETIMKKAQHSNYMDF